MKNKVLEYIGKNQLEKAIELIEDNNTRFSILARFNKLKKDEYLGLIDNGRSTMVRAQITQSILSCFDMDINDKIPEISSKQAGFSKTETINTSIHTKFREVYKEVRASDNKEAKKRFEDARKLFHYVIDRFIDNPSFEVPEQELRNRLNNVLALLNSDDKKDWNKVKERINKFVDSSESPTRQDIETLMNDISACGKANDDTREILGDKKTPLSRMYVKTIKTVLLELL